MKAFHKKSAIILSLLLLCITLFSGCSYSIGSVQNEWGGKIDASYVSFDGTKDKSIKLSAGETLVMDYKVTVNKGSLTLNITGPDGNVLWEQKFTSGSTGNTVEVPAQKAGEYMLNIIAENTGGGYHIKLDKK